MTKEKVLVRIREVVECFQDCWDSHSESHYTQDWNEEQENTYSIEVSMDNDGNILEDIKDIEKKVKEVSVGNVLDFDILG